jgi:hypothetical protein
MRSQCILILTAVIAFLTSCQTSGSRNRKNNNPVDAATEPTRQTSTSMEANVDAMLNALTAAPAWTRMSDPDRAGDRRRLSVALSFVAGHSLAQIRTVVQRYLKQSDFKSGFQDIHAVSKLYVLNRYIFAVPDTENPDGVRFFGGFRGEPENAGSMNMCWPLAVSGNDISIVGICHGYNGDYYDALEEFDYFRARYGPRFQSAGGKTLEKAP